jgi:hypothetical protein
MLKLLRLSIATRFTLAGAAVIAITPLCLSFMPARQSGRPIVINNVRIFDGSTVIPTGAVIIEGGKIKSVGKTIAPPDGAEIIDGTDHTLLPGLIDSHTHAYGAALKQAVMFGVTTELDMFSDHRTAVQMRKEQAEGKATDPRSKALVTRSKRARTAWFTYSAIARPIPDSRAWSPHTELSSFRRWR